VVRWITPNSTWTARNRPCITPKTLAAAKARYSLHHVGRRDGDIAYAVYAAPDLADAEVSRIADERDYARRFEATPQVAER
jgi:hypothetical protein